MISAIMVTIMHVYALSKIPDSVVLAIHHKDDRAKILYGIMSPQVQITMADTELVDCINQYMLNKTNTFQHICDDTLSSTASTGDFNRNVTVSGLGSNITNMSQLANSYFVARGILNGTDVM
jgi:hypothetical protein